MINENDIKLILNNVPKMEYPGYWKKSFPSITLASFAEILVTKEVREDYHKVLNSLNICSSQVIIEHHNYDLGNRHFINRKLTDQFDYDFWHNNDLNSIGRLKDKFDADHMNPIGANIFTKKSQQKLTSINLTSIN